MKTDTDKFVDELLKKSSVRAREGFADELVHALAEQEIQGDSLDERVNFLLAKPLTFAPRDMVGRVERAIHSRWHIAHKGVAALLSAGGVAAAVMFLAIHTSAPTGFSSSISDYERINVLTADINDISTLIAEEANFEYFVF